MKERSFEPAAGSARTAYFDYLKAFEYLMLMVVHTASYKWYTVSPSSADWLVLNFFKSATRPCVLVFFMISGALMLGREIPLKKIYGKYILKLAIAFLFWDIVYAVITYWNDGIHGIIFKIFNSNYHLWYLLAMIGIYICFPLLKAIAENRRIMKYYLILSAVFAFLLPSFFTLCSSFGSGTSANITRLISEHIYSMHMNTVLGYPFFFVAGYFLHTTDLTAAFRRSLYVLGILAIISGAAVNAVYVRMTGSPADTFNSAFMLHEMITALAVFVFFKYNTKGNPVLEKAVKKISDWGLGIYVLHDLMILAIWEFTGLNAMSFNPLFAVPVLAVIAFILSTAVSALLNLIPGVKKYLV